MRKLFWLFMMLMLAACGGGGGSSADTPSATGKGSLSLELVQSGARVAKTLASTPIAASPGRVRVVLNETTKGYRKIVDKAFGETIGNIELPVGTYSVEAIFYASGTPNLLTDYGVYSDANGPTTVTIGNGTNENKSLTMNHIDVDMVMPGASVDSGALYTVGSPLNLAANGLDAKWSLNVGTSAFGGRKHLGQPASATHAGLTAPAVAVVGSIYFQGEFFVKATLVAADESATNWAFFTEDTIGLTLPQVPVTIVTPTDDGQNPVVKFFSVPSAKQGTRSVSGIGILGADNGGIKQYAITYSETPLDLASMTAPATGWSDAPSFTLPDSVAIDTHDKEIYLYAWVKDFSTPARVSSQVAGVTNQKIVFNTSPAVTTFSAPITMVTNSNSIPVTIQAKGYNGGSLQCAVTEAPTPDSAVWLDMSPQTATVPASAAFTYDASIAQAAGVRYNVTLYAWVKEGTAVSPYVARPVSIDDSPQIAALAVTGAADGNTVSITRLDVTNVRPINGYAITTTSTKPLPGAFTASNGVPSLPLSYTFTSGITSSNPTNRALYVWVKDNGGAISAARGTGVALTHPTPTP